MDAMTSQSFKAKNLPPSCYDLRGGAHGVLPVLDPFTTTERLGQYLSTMLLIIVHLIHLTGESFKCETVSIIVRE
jgi:hypothetical protein